MVFEDFYGFAFLVSDSSLHDIAKKKLAMAEIYCEPTSCSYDGVYSFYISL